jgi:hypothetical protein
MRLDYYFNYKLLSTYFSTQDEVRESMDCVNLKKNKNKKKWNDACRKRIKEKTGSVTNERSSILEK